MSRQSAPLALAILGLIAAGCTEPQAGSADDSHPFPPSREAGERTTVLVLGTPHLSALEERFEPALLESLLERLVAYAPDVIGLESIPPASLADMLSRPEFEDVVAQFAGERAHWGQEMQRETGLSWLEAADSADVLLEKDRESGLSPLQRQRLIRFLLAAYDDLSAVLHWSYLPEDVSGSDVAGADSIHVWLEDQTRSANENGAIGIELARRLGLRRLLYIDDHHDKDQFLDIAPSLIEELNGNETFASVLGDPFIADTETRLEQAVAIGDLLPFYRFINTPDYGRADAALQWDVWLRTGLESGLDRTRLALWEVRNLNMASHIRRATATIPGGRTLVVVGNGHRQFLESYLTLMTDVRLVWLDNL
jgi:hypothetical protein